MIAKKLLSFIFFCIAWPVITSACEIHIVTDSPQKENYKTGDVVVVKITVVLKHRNCDVDINETAIKVSGLQITGTTKWTNTEKRTWERKIKVKITGDKKQAIITAERTCDRDGGKGSLTLITG
jgi:hypothetical protein